MATTEEGWHTVDDGFKLFTKTWKPAGAPVAKVVLIHGFSDKCENYNEAFNTLASKGIEVLGFDQRGFGRSATKPHEKGNTGPSSRVFADLNSILRSVIPSPVPLFLLGHSMGGGLVLEYIANGPADIKSHIRGYLLEAPEILLHPQMAPNPIRNYAGRLAKRVVPRLTTVAGTDYETITRDPHLRKVFKDDPLLHDTGSLEFFAGMLDRGKDLYTGKIKVTEGNGEGGKTRVWLGHGSGDLCNSYDASKKFMEDLEVEDKEFKTYEGGYHVLHAEPDGMKEAFVEDVANWILARVGATPADSVEPTPKL